MHVRPYSLTDNYESSGVYKYQDFYVKKDMLPDARHIQVTAMKGGLLKAKGDFDGIVLKGTGEDFDWATFTIVINSVILFNKCIREGQFSSQ